MGGPTDIAAIQMKRCYFWAVSKEKSGFLAIDAIFGLFLRRNQAFWPYFDHFGRILALAPPKSAKIF